MATIKKPVCTSGIIGIFTFILFIVTAQAEQPINCLLCFDMKTTTIVETEDLIIMGSESRGIDSTIRIVNFSTTRAVHLVGLIKIDKGKVTGSDYWQVPDPAVIFMSLKYHKLVMKTDWKFIYGTGKFKGIIGSGKSLRFTKGRPVSPGTSQVCSKITGTYELK